MIYNFEEFINEGKKIDLVIVQDIDDCQECMKFLGTKVDETEIQKLWKKVKGDKQKFAEAVFAEYPDVYEIQHTFSNKEGEGEYIERENGKWTVYYN